MTPPYEEEVDLREFLRVLGRYRWFIAAVTLIAVLAAALASVFMPSVYRVEAVVEMEKTDAKGSQQSEGKAVLESRVLLKAALEGLGLQPNLKSLNPGRMPSKTPVICALLWRAGMPARWRQ